MKKTHLLLGLILSMTGLVSCNEDVLVDLNGDGLTDATNGYVVQSGITPVTADIYLPVSASPKTLEVCVNSPYNLTAGQHINAGTVEVVNDGQNLYVTYKTTGILGNLHLWVGTDMLNVPSNRNGVPVPGQFPFQYDASGLQNATIVVPLKDNNYICGTQLYFIAHAEVTINGNKETAFGGGTGVNIADNGRWYFYDTYIIQCCTFSVPENREIKRVETAYAKPPKIEAGNTGYVFVGKPSKTNKSNPESYAALSLTQNRWGWAVNLKTFGTYTYPLWAAAGLNNTSNGIPAGTVTLVFNSSGITATYDLGNAGVLEEVHIYADDFKVSVIAPGQYGFTKYFAVPFVEKSFTQSFAVTDTNADGIWVVLHSVVGIF
jgi:hypothetical protein